MGVADEDEDDVVVPIFVELDVFRDDDEDGVDFVELLLDFVEDEDGEKAVDGFELLVLVLVFSVEEDDLVEILEIALELVFWVVDRVELIDFVGVE